MNSSNFFCTWPPPAHCAASPGKIRLHFLVDCMVYPEQDWALRSHRPRDVGTEARRVWPPASQEAAYLLTLRWPGGGTQRSGRVTRRGAINGCEVRAEAS